MEISYKIVTHAGSGGKADYIEEFANGELVARYRFGYFEDCSGCMIIYPINGGQIKKMPDVPYMGKRVSFRTDKIEKSFRENDDLRAGKTTYVVWLRTKPYTACKKIDDDIVERYWVNGNDRNELFTLKERLTPQERAAGRKAKMILISTRIDNIQILK